MHLLVHLSDLHITSSNCPLDKARAHAIATSLRAAALQIDSCTLLVTGDIAQSALADEYNCAFDFFSELTESIKSELRLKNVATFFVPGNHDCDFSQDNSVRDAVLPSIPNLYPSVPTTIEDACVSVQHNFKAFASIFHDANVDASWRLECEMQPTASLRATSAPLPPG